MSGKRNTTTNIEESTPPPVAYTISEFCKAHRLSESFYYELRQSGCGPREIVLGSRRLISAEDAAAWRRERAEQPQPKISAKKNKAQ
jgi:hypothetical protein